MRVKALLSITSVNIYAVEQPGSFTVTICKPASSRLQTQQKHRRLQPPVRPASAAKSNRGQNTLLYGHCR